MRLKITPFNSDSKLLFSAPEPMSTSIPSWMTKMPLYADGGKKLKVTPTSANETVKACSPFLDTFLTGYIIKLAVDIHVSKDGDNHNLVWRTGRAIETHSPSQISKAQTQDKYGHQPFKFMNEWVVNTPKGYSTLFTHPLNRTDLPFETLAGVVETDTYKLPINFPFLLDKDYEGVLERGTPIVQLIPFKREPWRISEAAFDEEVSKKSRFDFYAKMIRPYKSLHWVKKDYR